MQHPEKMARFLFRLRANTRGTACKPFSLAPFLSLSLPLSPPFNPGPDVNTNRARKISTALHYIKKVHLCQLQPMQHGKSPTGCVAVATASESRATGSLPRLYRLPSGWRASRFLPIQRQGPVRLRQIRFECRF